MSNQNIYLRPRTKESKQAFHVLKRQKCKKLKHYVGLVATRQRKFVEMFLYTLQEQKKVFEQYNRGQNNKNENAFSQKAIWSASIISLAARKRKFDLLRTLEDTETCTTQTAQIWPISRMLVSY